MAHKVSPFFEGCGTEVRGNGNADLLKLDKKEVIGHFNRSGLVFFTGFASNTEKFKRFSDLFGSDFGNYAGGSHGRAKVKGYQDIAETHSYAFGGPPVGGDCIPAHAEMTYLENYPKIVWFACARPPIAAGETTIYDGIEFWDMLSSSTRKLFSKKRIKYTAFYPQPKWPEIFQASTIEGVKAVCQKNGVGFKVGDFVSGGKVLYTSYSCWAARKHRFGKTAFLNHILTSLWVESLGASFVRVRFEDSTRIPHEVAIELFETSESIAHEIAWQAGDIAMIDNTRFLHGRRGFFGRRNVHIRQCHEPIAEFQFPARSRAGTVPSSRKLIGSR